MLLVVLCCTFLSMRLRVGSTDLILCLWGGIFMDISVLTESLFGPMFFLEVSFSDTILFGLFQKGIQLTLCNGTQNHDFVGDFPNPSQIVIVYTKIRCIFSPESVTIMRFFLETPEAPPQNFPKSAPKNEVDIFMNTWCLETFWLNIRNIWECLG